MSQTAAAARRVMRDHAEILTALAENTADVELERLRASARKYAEDGRWCWYCGRDGHGSDDNILEHMTPESRGGASDSSNLVIACRSCNSLKGPSTVEEFRELLAARMRTEVVFAGELSARVEGAMGWLHLASRTAKSVSR